MNTRTSAGLLQRASLAASLGAVACTSGARMPPADAAPGRALDDFQTGIATYYNATGEGNCSFDATPGDLMVTAMNTPQYDNSAVCGTCLEVQGPRGNVTVRVVDRCPECASGHLDLSREAFARIAEPAQGRVSIQWRRVACAVDGPVAYRFKEGSSQWWVGIQVRNHRLPVQRLEVQRNGSWVDVPRRDYNYFVADSGLGPGPFSIRVTASDGQQITDTNIALQVAQVVAGTQQFR